MGKRRLAREYALEFLYGIEFFNKDDNMTEEPLKDFLQRHSNEDSAVMDFAKVLITGTLKHLGEIDRLIQETAERWNIDRMAVIDKTILRIATYELLYHPETPPAVIINEALEIAKKYSTADSSSFINGILDPIAKDKRKKLNNSD